MFESYIEKMTKLTSLDLKLGNDELGNLGGIKVVDKISNLVNLVNLTELKLKL